LLFNSYVKDILPQIFFNVNLIASIIYLLKDLL